MTNYFEELNSVDVTGKIEKKNGLSYLSWAWAWTEVKKRHPEAIYTIYENNDGMFYHTDGKTCWVKTGVTVNGVEHIEYLPVMNFKNQSILLQDITSVDVNKAIQRSLTKACARHGLGLYVYAGEDLPEKSQNNGIETTSGETNETSLFERIQNCLDEDELKAIYRDYKAEICANDRLLQLVTDRGRVLKDVA